MAYNNNGGGWNNNQNNAGGGYNRNNYGGGGYNRNNYGGGGYNQSNGQRAKKSGVTYSKIKQGQFEGLMIVNAWLKTKESLLTLKIAPYNKTREKVKTDSGKEYLKYICEARYSNGNHRIIPVLYSVTTRKISIQELNLLVTPNGAGVTSSGKKVTGSVVRLNG